MFWIIVPIIVIFVVAGLFRGKNFDQEMNEHKRNKQKMQTRDWW